MRAALQRLRYRVVLVLQLLVTGRWRELRYRAWLKMHGIDLGFVSVDQLEQSPELAHLHSTSGGPDLEVVLEALKICPDDAVIDVGCGKAGALITMAQFPFVKVCGIEISEPLVEVALRNLSRLGLERVRVEHADAAVYTQLDEYTFVYLYNPFPCGIVQRFMANLVGSLQRRPRNLTLIYKNPKCDEVVRSAGLVKRQEFSHARLPYFVYVHEPERARSSS